MCVNNTFEKPITINSCRFINCSASGDGGAIYICTRPVLITLCIFENNAAETHKGNDIFITSNIPYLPEYIENSCSSSDPCQMWVGLLDCSDLLKLCVFENAAYLSSGANHPPGEDTDGVCV
jgi:hypothetical protein